MVSAAFAYRCMIFGSTVLLYVLASIHIVSFNQVHTQSNGVVSVMTRKCYARCLLRHVSRLALLIFTVAFAFSPAGYGQSAGSFAPPDLKPLACSDINQNIEDNEVYLLYKKAQSLKQDQTITNWDWYRKPAPQYNQQTLDPLAEQPIGVHPAVFQRKSIQCQFPKNAQLEGADFHGSDLSNSGFSGGNLRNASFDRWGGNGPPTILRDVTFSGVDLTDASFDHADMAGVHFEPSKLPPAKNIATASNLEQMTYDEDPSALGSLRQSFRDGGFSLQDSEINYAIHIRQRQISAERCGLWAKSIQNSYRSCVDYFGSKVIDWTCQYGMNAWRPVAIGAWGWALFTVLFFFLMHHPGPSGLYLAVADGLTLEPDAIRNAPQVRSTVAWELLKRKDVPGWLREELRLFRIAAFFSLVNGFNIGFKDADIGRWIRLLPAREFEFRAVGWSRTFAGIQALLTLYLLALWILCLFGHPFG